ncbi:MAG: amidohydrolase family protein [Cyclobacteriaceae bacterium]
MKPYLIKPLLLLALSLTWVACGSQTDTSDQAPGAASIAAFTHAKVITMQNNNVLDDQTVLVKDGKIEAIANFGSIEIPEGAEIIEANGQYLMPGLAEMHAHIPTPSQGEVEETLFLYLAGGVTTIRGMLGDPFHLKLREQVKNGEVLGPRIYTSGPSLNGNSTPDVESAQTMVREQKAAGYDFLKIHPGLTLEVFDAMVETAKEEGINFSGHVSRQVGIRHALASGYASVDHLDQYIEGMVPEDTGVDPGENGFFGFNFTDLADSSLMSGLILETKQAGVWQVPTQCLAERWAGLIPAAQLAQEPEMKYMKKSVIQGWTDRGTDMQADRDPGQVQRYIDIRRKLIKAMQDGGVGLLLGSDAPQVFNVPGFSAQHELEMYVDAGLTNYQALVTGTTNPAAFFKVEGEYGVIAPGASADLILLKDNPLEDITNLRAKEGVMIKGEWLSKERIAEELAKIADKYATGE